MKKQIINEKIMKVIANETSLIFDGGEDNRLFVSDHISVDVSKMSKKQYDRMEKELNKKQIKRKGYSVSAWNDSSGYKYWKEGSKYMDFNYIQVTVYIIDFNYIDFEQIREDVQTLTNYFSKYDICN